MYVIPHVFIPPHLPPILNVSHEWDIKGNFRCDYAPNNNHICIKRSYLRSYINSDSYNSVATNYQLNYITACFIATLACSYVYFVLLWSLNLTLAVKPIEINYCNCYQVLQWPALNVWQQHVLQPLNYPNLPNWKWRPKNCTWPSKQ